MDHASLHHSNSLKGAAEARKQQTRKRRSFLLKSKRDEVVSKHRNLTPLKETKRLAANAKGMKLKEKMKEWKKEKELKRLQEKRKQKPMFKFTSQIDRCDRQLFDNNNNNKGGQRDAGPSRNTRSKTGTKMSAANKKKVLPVRTNRRAATKKNTEKSAGDKVKKSTKTAVEKSTKATDNSDTAIRKSGRKSFAPSNFQFQPPAGLRKLDFDSTLPQSTNSFRNSNDFAVFNLANSTPAIAPISVIQVEPVVQKFEDIDRCSNAKGNGRQSIAKKANPRRSVRQKLIKAKVSPCKESEDVVKEKATPDDEDFKNKGNREEMTGRSLKSVNDQRSRSLRRTPLPGSHQSNAEMPEYNIDIRASPTFQKSSPALAVSPVREETSDKPLPAVRLCFDEDGDDKENEDAIATKYLMPCKNVQELQTPMGVDAKYLVAEDRDDSALATPTPQKSKSSRSRKSQSKRRKSDRKVSLLFTPFRPSKTSQITEESCPLTGDLISFTPT